MIMKKTILPFVVAAFAITGSAVIQDDDVLAASKTARERDGKRPVMVRDTMEGYARIYDNLVHIDGKRPSDYRLVQICLLLDTSNSMDGLIRQAKSELWRIVNRLSMLHKRGENIRLQVALYEYGNNSLSARSGYIRQVTPFTEDLDLLSEKLFSLDTNGGSEYCGHVIGSSLNRLSWNNSKEGLKLIFIAGNEPFNQGEVSYEAACSWAAERDVIVNTIYCGDYQTGIDTLWQRGAILGKGNYFAIDSDRMTIGIPTPYDDELIRLNGQINRTYVPYGSSGQEKRARQEAQDMNAASLAAPVQVERAVTKSTSLYKSKDWDLVDADDATVEKLDRKQLPAELQKMSRTELKSYVGQQKKEREGLKSQIADLSRKRDEFMKRKEVEVAGRQSLGSAIVDNLRTQAEAKHFTFQ
jgi:hypothetical protein